VSGKIPFLALRSFACPIFLPASPQADKQRGPGSKTKTPGLPEQTPESLQQSNQLAD